MSTDLFSRGLGQHVPAGQGTLSAAQNRAVLIAGLTCACFSLLVTFITLRWFILMKRTFRHRLVMLLILSDTFKAIWYFVFPVVVFSRGPVDSSSKFCQASGFFLALGIEASDFAILTIALHSILYIFRPPTRSGSSGGIYKYRKFIPIWWIGGPVLLASLAFVNDGNAYVTTGTICYLPKRPFWYRLALAWIPRYIIISTIFLMYGAVYIYVSIKFHGFSNLGDSDSNYGTESLPTSAYGSRSQSMDETRQQQQPPPQQQTPQPDWSFKKFNISRPAFSRANSFQNIQDVGPKNSMAEPWENVSFITSRHLNAAWQQGVQTSDFAQGSSSDEASQETQVAPAQNQTYLTADEVDPMSPANRKRSSTPTENTSYTGDTISTSDPKTHKKHLSKGSAVLHRVPSNDPLKRTRSAIRKQLRYLFIYPLVYVVMWIFPFTAHCLLYDDYFASHPIFWLSVLQTCMLALQASADCIVFSWREKPWRRIPDESRFTVYYWHRQSKHFMEKRRSRRMPGGTGKEVENNDNPNGSGENNDAELGTCPTVTPSRATSAHWWEAEGKKRKDSVWMGVDLTTIASRFSDRRGTMDTVVNEEESEQEQADTSAARVPAIVEPEDSISPKGNGAETPR